MFSIWLALSVVILLEAGITLAKSNQFRKFFESDFLRDPQKPLSWPLVALVAPLKGMDMDLKLNIESWLRQDYPKFTLFFVVDSVEDPVVPLLRKYPASEILMAGRAVDCGQKVHNLRYAVDHLPAEYELFAFVDSDARVNGDWLKSLVAGVAENPGGASTGYRWFVGANGGFATQVRAVWNSSILTLLSREGKGNFAWGGSMAVSRETFAAAQVLKFWEGAISDDYGLTNALNASGRKIRFVPRALAFTEDTIRFSEFFCWARRQLLITRIYNASLWRLALLHHSLWMFWIIGGVLFWNYFLPVFLFTWICQGWKAEIRLKCAGLAAKQNAGSRLHYWILSPFIGILNFVLLVSTTFSKTIRWRDMEYVVSGPNRTKIKNIK